MIEHPLPLTNPNTKIINPNLELAPHEEHADAFSRTRHLQLLDNILLDIAQTIPLFHVRVLYQNFEL